MDQFIFDPPPVGFETRKGTWTTNFVALYNNAQTEPGATILGAYHNDELIGFISGDVFQSPYDEHIWADMKDCVTFPSDQEGRAQPAVFVALFDAFLEYYKEVGVVRWRFDSIRKDEDQAKVAEFIERFYCEDNQIETTVSIRGIQTEK